MALQEVKDLQASLEERLAVLEERVAAIEGTKSVSKELPRERGREESA